MPYLFFEAKHVLSMIHVTGLAFPVLYLKIMSWGCKICLSNQHFSQLYRAQIHKYLSCVYWVKFSFSSLGELCCGTLLRKPFRFSNWGFSCSIIGSTLLMIISKGFLKYRDGSDKTFDRFVVPCEPKIPSWSCKFYVHLV